MAVAGGGALVLRIGPSTSSTSSSASTASPQSPLVLRRRAVGILDLIGDNACPEPHIGAAALLQLGLVRDFALSVFAFPAAPHAPRVFASDGWRTAATLVLILPAPGRPAGVWSSALAMLTQVADGSVGPLARDLVALGRSAATDKSTIGVVLLDPNAGGVSAEPTVHLSAAWDTLLASAETGNTGANIVFVTHGSTADTVVALCVDATRGAAVRARTRACAFLAPRQPPRAALTALALLSPSGRAGAGAARALLRQKAIAFHAVPTGAHANAPAPGVDRAASAALVVEPTVKGTLPPYASNDYGCRVVPIAVSVAGLAAHRDSADALLDAFTPSAARSFIVSFVKHFASSQMTIPDVAGSWALTLPDAKAEDLVFALPSTATTSRDPSREPSQKRLEIISTSKPVTSITPVPQVNTEKMTTPSTVPSPAVAAVATTPAVAAVATPSPLLTPAVVAVATPSPLPTPAVVAAATPSPLPSPAVAAVATVQVIDGSASATTISSTPSELPPSPTLSPLPLPSFSSPTRTAAVSAVSPTPTPDTPSTARPLLPLFPAPFNVIAERAFARLSELHIDAFAPGGGKEWKETSTSNGVRMYLSGEKASRPVGADPNEPFVGARGDSVLAFPVSALHDALLDDALRFELDAQVDKIQLVAEVGVQGRVERMLFKPVFPTDPRDFCTFSAWRVDADGALYFAATSIEDARAPVVKGYVRGCIDVGGWVATPLNEADFGQAVRSLGLPSPTGPFIGACRVSYLFRTSIGGTLPKFIVQQVTAAQAKRPAQIARALEKRFAKKSAANLALLSKRMCNIGESEKDDIESVITGASSADSITTSSDSSVTGSENTQDPSPTGTAPLVPVAVPSVDLVSASSSSSLPPPYSFNLSGTWKEDKARSTPLDDMLREMGIPWVFRRVAASIDATSAITHSAETCVVIDTSNLGNNTTTLYLDGELRMVKGTDGKVTKQTAMAAGGSAAGAAPLESATALFAIMRAAATATPPSPDGHPSIGDASGGIVIHSILPEGLGESIDVRSLSTPNVMRLQTLYLRDGLVKARLDRYFMRWNMSKNMPVPSSTQTLIEPVFIMSPQVAASPEASTVTTATASSTVTVAAPVTDMTTPLKSPLPPATPLSPPSPFPVSSPPLSPTKEWALATSRSNAGSSGATASASGDSVIPVASPLPLPVLSTPSPLLLPTTAPSIIPLLSKNVIADVLPPSPPIAGVTVVRLLPEGARVRAGDWSFSRWIPDNIAVACSGCSKGFSPLLRRHHCRECGGAFCDPCSLARMPLAHFSTAQLRAARQGPTDYVRLCSGCAKPVVFTHTRVGSRGGRVTITGAHFGTAELAAAGRVVVTVERVAVNGQTSPLLPPARARRVTLDTPFTGMTFSLPPGTGFVNLRVTVDGRRSEAVPFWYDGPILTRVAEPADTDGGAVEVHGENLGDTADSLRAFDFRAGGVPCEVALRVVIPHEVILVRVPPGSGAGKTLQLCVGLARAPDAPRSSIPLPYASPEVFAAKLEETAAAAALTLYGRNFGAADKDIEIKVGGIPCAALILHVPHAKVRVIMPPEALVAIREARISLVPITLDFSVSGLNAPVLNLNL